MAANTVICTFRVKRGHERPFQRLLKVHWPTLKRLGLVTAEPSRLFRGKDASKKTCFVEIFTWKNQAAFDFAHRSPEVMAVWEPMGAHVEKRLGRPAWEFPHFEPVKARRGRA